MLLPFESFWTFLVLARNIMEKPKAREGPSLLDDRRANGANTEASNDGDGLVVDDKRRPRRQHVLSTASTHAAYTGVPTPAAGVQCASQLSPMVAQTTNVAAATLQSPPSSSMPLPGVPLGDPDEHDCEEEEIDEPMTPSSTTSVSGPLHMPAASAAAAAMTASGDDGSMIRPMDIICGRGSRVTHPGNQRFRALVQKHKDAYQQAQRRDDKTRITQGIVDTLTRGPEPSR